MTAWYLTKHIQNDILIYVELFQGRFTGFASSQRSYVGFTDVVFRFLAILKTFYLPLYWASFPSPAHHLAFCRTSYPVGFPIKDPLFLITSIYDSIRHLFSRISIFWSTLTFFLITFYCLLPFFSLRSSLIALYHWLPFLLPICIVFINLYTFWKYI